MSQGPFLRKYGVAATIDFDLFQVDGIDFRVDAVHAAGDTKIMKDEGVEANTTNGFTDEGQSYSIVLTATEMQAARVRVLIVDQTATKAWLDTSIVIETYGHASAQHAMDFDDAVRGGMTALPNAAADAAGGLPISDAGGLDLDTKLAATNEVTAVRMGALTDWVNGGRLDLILDIIAADVVNLDGAAMRGTDGAALASVCTETRLSELDAATGGKMANVVDAIDTLTKAAGPGDLAAILVDTGTSIPALIGALNDLSAAQVNAEVDSALNTAIPATPAANSINERIKALDDNYTAARAPNLDNLDATVSSRQPSGAVTVGTNNDKTGYRLSPTGVDDVLDETYEGTTTLRQFLRLAAAAMFGKLSGAATASVKARDEADTKDRITATVDSDGNRSAVTLDKTA